ncbi:MAG: DNA polymerase I [Armatimonadetes bacterium]|nr:DNA polymerase I [Armatimonadota bacterium]
MVQSARDGAAEGSKMVGKLFVIDGHNLLFRAFYAITPLMTREGIHTNAVYGFVRMFLKILREYKPTHIAVVLDPPGATFRHEAYEGYKAQRERAPESFREQVKLVTEFLKLVGVEVWQVPEYEADDLMATAARRAEEAGMEVYLVTGDMDALQLVSDRVKVLSCKRGISDTVVYDSATVKMEMGILPSQIPDLKALSGDASDNIPGIPGIGERTAQRLILEFGNLERVIESAPRIADARLREAILQHADEARRWRKLTLLRDDAPICINWERCSVERLKLQSEELAKFFQQLEFERLIDELELRKFLVREVKVSYEVMDASAVANLLSSIRRHGSVTLAACIDGEIKGVAMSVDGRHVYYIPIGGTLETSRASQKPVGSSPIQPSLFDLLQEGANSEGESFDVPLWLSQLMNDVNLEKRVHDLKGMLRRCGGLLRGVSIGAALSSSWRDARLMAYLYDPDEGDYELEDLSRRLGVSVSVQRPSVAHGDDDLALQLAKAVCITHIACEHFEPHLRSCGMWQLLTEIEQPLSFVLADMERHGVLIDVPYLQRMSEETQAELHRLEEAIYSLAGIRFNIRSSRQLGHVLFERLKLPRGRRTKTGYSTASDVLEALAPQHEIAARVLEYRELEKLRSTYIEGLLELADARTGRVHTNYEQAGASTGRLSSSSPNLQNIPIRSEWGKRIRRAFIAPSGYKLVSADYSQIELRMLAHISGDETLCEAFERGEDIHAATAARIFGVPLEQVNEDMRRRAKVINFGIIYGMSSLGLSQQLGISEDEAASYIRSYLNRYPKVRQYIEETIAHASEYGYVATMFGRRRYVRGITSSDEREREAAKRVAINAPIQGSAADIMKLAMVRLWSEMNRRRMRSKLIMQVHDELICEAHSDEVDELITLMRDIMESIVKLRVPLKVDIKAGDNWLEMREVQ